MRRKLSLITMLTAWLLATGSHWDLVQTFAWGRMIATYSQTMSVAQAVQLTFTADTLCGLCESVSEAKQQQDSAAASDAKAVGKITLIYQAQSVWVAEVPECGRWNAGDVAPNGIEGDPPPVRPPRVVV